MHKPKMIIFDYGNTLACEPDFSPIQGEKALLSLAENCDNIIAEELLEFGKNVLNKKVKETRKLGFEFSGQTYNRLIFERFGLTTKVSPLEVENIFWTAASIGKIMPETDILLNFLKSENIRTAVISNTMWSGKALNNRLDRLLPNNEFEFVFTSSDYSFRKPNPFMFELALKTAKLNASEVWYCGDSSCSDVEGSASVGIYPVWYCNSNKADTRGYGEIANPQCEHLKINEWSELINLLKSIK